MLELSLTTAILNSVIKTLPPPEKRDELADVFANYWFDLDGPKKLNYKPTQEAEFIEKVFRFWVSILSSYNQLHCSIKFLEAVPEKEQQIKNSEYLQYHAEVYVQNAYILFERTRHFYKRCYKKTSLFDNKLADELDAQIDVIRKSLPIIKVRDEHVHSHNIYIDETLKKISSYELMAEVDKTEFGTVFALLAENEIQTAKEKLFKQFQDSQATFQKYLISFSNFLLPYLSKNNELLIPSKFD